MDLYLQTWLHYRHSLEILSLILGPPTRILQSVRLVSCDLSLIIHAAIQGVVVRDLAMITHYKSWVDLLFILASFHKSPNFLSHVVLLG